jgi:RNA polymerase sigma factor (TIGR02999 family)
MSNVTPILSKFERGDPRAAEQLLPLVYDELRRLAAARMAQEKPGQTLQATALVHEAYIRLVDAKQVQHWASRGHFYGAAAEAMRRILVEAARRKGRVKRGAGIGVVSLDKVEIGVSDDLHQVVAIDEALNRLETQSAVAAQLVKLRYFAGFSVSEAADVLGISPRKADQVWAYARSWLLAELGENAPG